jgi:hypothetical protein
MTPVTSLEVSKRMKELGFKGKTVFGWVNYNFEDEHGAYVGEGEGVDDWQARPNPEDEADDFIPAYLSDEIAEMLPRKSLTFQAVGTQDVHVNFTSPEWSCATWGSCLAEALGIMAIRLKEQGII